MTPDPVAVLEAMATSLEAEVLPHVRSPFAQQAVLLNATLAAALAQDVDGLADRLAAENEAVAGLLRDGLAMADAPARDAIERGLAALAGERSLRVSALGEVNRALRGALIALHAAVEGRDDAGAGDFDTRIWAEYRAQVARRRMEVPR